MFRKLRNFLFNSRNNKNSQNRTFNGRYSSRNSNNFNNTDNCVSLVKDTSGSMAGEKIQEGKKSLLNLVDSLDDKNVALGLISFGSRVTLETDLTKNFREVRKSIKSLRAGGGTPLFEGIQLSKQEHLDRFDGQKILVIDTDGKPNSTGKDEILAYGQDIKDEGVQIITIGIGGDVNSSFLRRLASTPEDYYFAKAPKDIVDVIQIVTGSLVRKVNH